MHTAADVTAAVSFPRVPAVVMVSAVAVIPGALVLSTVDVPGVSAVAKVSAVATIPTYVDVLSATSISNVSCVPAVVVVPAVADFSTVTKLLFLFPPILASLINVYTNL